MTPTKSPSTVDRDAVSGAPGLDDAFLAVLAHELRNPLAPLRTSLDLLGRPQVAEETKQRARDIMARQLTKMARLIDELAEVARIGHGRVTLHREPADAGELLNAALEAARPGLDEKQLQLELVQSEPARVDVDRARIVQALTTMVADAARRSDRGRHLWLRVQSSAGGVVLAVRDEGMGIPDERLSSRFALFADDAAPDEGPGSRDASVHAVASVGLMLASRLVALHGGELRWRDHAPGEGHEEAMRLPAGTAG